MFWLKFFLIKTKILQCGYECGYEFECEFKTEDNKTKATTTSMTNTVAKENDVIFNKKTPQHPKELLKRLKWKSNKSTI